jgi:hypothetical protein
MDTVIRRKFQSALCVVVALSLSNGFLLAMQFYAWASMAHERAADLGYPQAIIASIETQELCGVCVIVVDETARKNVDSLLRLIDPMVKMPASGDTFANGGRLKTPSPKIMVRLSDSPMHLDGFIEDAVPPPPRTELS